MAGFYKRENRVPYYQALFQAADRKHIRQWQTTSRSRFLLLPFYTIFIGTTAATMYAMGRLVFGKKTWFSD